MCIHLLQLDIFLNIWCKSHNVQPFWDWSALNTECSVGVYLCNKTRAFVLVYIISLKSPSTHPFLYTYCSNWMLFPYPVSPTSTSTLWVSRRGGFASGGLRWAVFNVPGDSLWAVSFLLRKSSPPSVVDGFQSALWPVIMIWSELATWISGR